MNVLSEGIIFASYAVICGGLAVNRPKKRTILWAAVIVGLIFLLQVILWRLGLDMLLIFALLPVTAYLPFSIGIYILSHYGLFQTAVVWSVGVLSVFTLKILKKIGVNFYIFTKSNYLTIFILSIAAGTIVFLALRYLRSPFQNYMDNVRKERLTLGFSILASLVLLSYYVHSNMRQNTMGLIIVLVAVFLMFFLVVKVLYSQVAVSRAEQSRQEMQYRMRVQYQEYENVCRKMEGGRVYRHDMRHHLLVLKGLAQQDDMGGILKYIEDMTDNLAETEHEIYCENTTVNAVLSDYIGRAKKARCKVTTRLHLPKELPFQEMDVCMVLANALENAINACGRIAEEKDRYIHIAAELADHKKLIILMKNPCRWSVNFDNDQIPVSSGAEGHGIGMKSIRAIAEKYHGFFQCKCEGGEFIFDAALFGTQPINAPAVGEEKKVRSGLGKKLVSAAAVFCSFLFIFMVDAYERIPAWAEELGENEFSRMFVERSWKAGWGDTWIHVEYPLIKDQLISIKEGLASIAGEQNAPSESGDGAELMSQEINAFVEEMKEKFLWYVMRKYEGYVGCDVTWRMVRDDEQILSVCIDGVINVGSSVQYSRYFTWDKAGGKLLELTDLFLEESDYVSVISSEILRQMQEQVQNNEGRYYITGLGWLEETCFHEIAPDQNFYLNEENQLVIVFEKYEVAPGSMGLPEFVLDTEVIREILRQPSVLSEMD